MCQALLSIQLAEFNRKQANFHDLLKISIQGSLFKKEFCKMNFYAVEGRVETYGALYLKHS